jgi:small subunit ribosomal protein S5
MSTNIRKVKTSDLELKDKLVSIQRVTKVTKGGRNFGFTAIVVVGNDNGIVGFGLGKAKEVTTAIAKGVEAAKKNLVKVPINKGTIPHEIEYKFGGARVFLQCVQFLKVLELLMFWQNLKDLVILIILLKLQLMPF